MEFLHITFFCRLGASQSKSGDAPSTFWRKDVRKTFSEKKFASKRGDIAHALVRNFKKKVSFFFDFLKRSNFRQDVPRMTNVRTDGGQSFLTNMMNIALA